MTDYNPRNNAKNILTTCTLMDIKSIIKPPGQPQVIDQLVVPKYYKKITPCKILHFNTNLQAIVI